MKIQAYNISKAFGNKTKDYKKVVDNTSFEIKSGRIVGIVGHNGSGKTTLGKILSTILKQDDGYIFFDDYKYEGKRSTIKQIHKDLTMTFQFPDSQLLKTTIEDEVNFMCKNYKLNNCDDFFKVTAKEFNLELIKNDSPFKKSWGQKRLINVASVLNSEPKLVIFDEPTTNLDFQVRKRFIDVLKNQKKLEQTFLIITHDLDLVWEICDDILVLKEGKIINSSTVVDFFQNQELVIKSDLDFPKLLKVCKSLKMDNCFSIKTIDDLINNYGN